MTLYAESWDRPACGEGWALEEGGDRRALCLVGNKVQQQTVGCPRSQDTASALSVDFGFRVPS